LGFWLVLPFFAHFRGDPKEFYALPDEQQRRLFAGLESIRVGHGGDILLGDFLSLDAHTVARGR
jgi:hypothetical protein